MKYLSLLAKRVEFKIRQFPPDLLSLLFDVWSKSDTHNIAIFAGFPAGNESWYKTYSLIFSPFENKASRNSEERKLYPEFVLNLFGKTGTIQQHFVVTTVTPTEHMLLQQISPQQGTTLIDSIQQLKICQKRIKLSQQKYMK